MEDITFEISRKGACEYITLNKNAQILDLIEKISEIYGLTVNSYRLQANAINSPIQGPNNFPLKRAQADQSEMILLPEEPQIDLNSDEMDIDGKIQKRIVKPRRFNVGFLFFSNEFKAIVTCMGKKYPKDVYAKKLSKAWKAANPYTRSLYEEMGKEDIIIYKLEWAKYKEDMRNVGLAMPPRNLRKNR